MKKLRDLFWNVHYGIKNFHSTHIYAPIQRIKTVIAYIPILWYDHDWDHFYFFALMEHKLKRMEKCLRNGNHLSCNKDADRIKICHTILKRLQLGEYDKHDMELHDAKWGELEMRFERVEDGEGGQHSQLFLERANVKTPENYKKESDEVQRIYKKANEVKKADLTLLFQTLNKYIVLWWD